jgi:NarL family two-component system response regulator LiaR
MPIRVLIVDDHAVVRQGLAALLQAAPDMKVVGGAASAAEAVGLVRREKPDVVLLDLVMPGEDGIAALPKLKAAHPAVRVLVLTSYVDADWVEPALAAGADGYLLKTSTAEGVLDAVRATVAGQRVLDTAALSALRELKGDDLTPREREVLRLVAEGLSNVEIAARLTVTVRTVKAHVSSLLHKLNLSDRTQLAIYALKREGRSP